MFWVWTVLIIGLGAIAISMLLANLSLAPWVPTKRKDLKRIIALADLNDGDVFCDLGSGTGTTVFAATKYSKGRGVGYELSWPVYAYARLRQLLSRNSRVQFYNKNLYKADLSEVDVLYIFGMPDKFKPLVKKLKAEAPAGMKLISYVFEIKELKYSLKDQPSDKDLPIYLYQF